MKNMLKPPTKEPREAATWALEFSSQVLSAEELIIRTQQIMGSLLNSESRELIESLAQDQNEYPDHRPGRQWRQPFNHNNVTLLHNDCFDWLQEQQDNSFHAVVTDPPYGLEEYTEKEQQKLRSGKGGVWRLPPSFDGSKRNPLPRFTTLTDEQLQRLYDYFFVWGRYLLPKLRPGAPRSGSVEPTSGAPSYGSIDQCRAGKPGPNSQVSDHPAGRRQAKGRPRRVQ